MKFTYDVLMNHTAATFL